MLITSRCDVTIRPPRKPISQWLLPLPMFSHLNCTAEVQEASLRMQHSPAHCRGDACRGKGYSPIATLSLHHDRTSMDIAGSCKEILHFLSASRRKDEKTHRKKTPTILVANLEIIFQLGWRESIGMLILAPRVPGSQGSAEQSRKQEPLQGIKHSFKAFPLASVRARFLYFDFSFCCLLVRSRAFQSSAAGMDKPLHGTDRSMHV